ncbi:MAG: amidohydrolase family protein [Dehalococcoidia bacterium]|nr:amidohydrolase family protein [Dehalococcoidia bacterium]
MAADAPGLLLRGGSVFDSEARAFAHGVDVLCTDDRIAAVGRGVQAPAGIVVLDCAGMYLVPGLIDCHVHITSSGDPAEMSSPGTLSLPTRAWKSAEHARATLDAGVTTARDLGAADRLNIDLARAIDDALLPGPTLLAAGLGVTMTGGHGHGFIAREADGPDEVRKAVREQLKAGAGAIKLFASGGVMTPGVDPLSPSLSEQELAAGVEEAHKAFRVVGAHAQSTEGIKNAIRAGVDSIEHGVWLDEEAIGLMVERGTYLVATLTAPWHIANGGLDAGIPPYMVDKAHQVLVDHIESFKRATAAGVLVAMGTDQGTPLNRPGENAQEILRMAEHGLSPAAALLAATAWAADLLRIDSGRIKEGLRADVLMLRRDPLDDLAALADRANFSAIIKRGRVVRQAPDFQAGGKS